MEVQADWTPVRNKYLRAPTQAHVKFSASPVVIDFGRCAKSANNAQLISVSARHRERPFRDRSILLILPVVVRNTASEFDLESKDNNEIKPPAANEGALQCVRRFSPSTEPGYPSQADKMSELL
uniref:Uncharacterized protein n=1 Tax=Coccidioides posadasii RMSCC 3488 TaxID=454284 RepID=A0A0J6FBH9_COCPO|nr:hypothetical protein CPAG_02653 [Coccidioides posadasii RMSCC 3488]